MRIADFMHTEIVTVTSSTLVSHAQKLMDEHRIRRLPIVDKDKLVGLITRGRIREVSGHHATSLTIWELNYLLDKMKVREIMITSLYTVTPDTPIETAVIESQKRSIGTLLVVDKDKPDHLLGLVTNTDLYKAILSILGFGQPSLQLTVGEPVPVGGMRDVLHTIVHHEVDILSAYRFSRTTNGDKKYYIHLITDDVDSIKDELKQKGYSTSSEYADQTTIKAVSANKD